MRKLSKPHFNVESVYNECISTVADTQLKTDLSNCLIEIKNDELLYDSLATNTALHQFPHKTNVNGTIDIPEMKKVYTYRMVANSGRVYYDIIYQIPKYGICPLCAHRDVETLDHHLPKALYPTLVVTPTNLVPSCEICNKKKLTTFPTSADDEPIHPYYDDIETDRWLYAKIERVGDGFIIKYEVRAPVTWTTTKTTRVEKHLTTFISSLYTKRAAIELSEKKRRLVSLRSISAAEVQQFTDEIFQDFFALYTNSWQTALYEALSIDTWFHNVGINCID